MAGAPAVRAVLEQRSGAFRARLGGTLIEAAGGVLEQLGKRGLLDQFRHDVGEFGLAHRFPSGRVLLEPRLVIVVAKHRREREVVREVSPVGLWVRTDGASVSHTDRGLASVKTPASGETDEGPPPRS